MWGTLRSKTIHLRPVPRQLIYGAATHLGCERVSVLLHNRFLNRPVLQRWPCRCRSTLQHTGFTTSSGLPRSRFVWRLRPAGCAGPVILAGEAVFALTTRLEYLDGYPVAGGHAQRWAARGPMASTVPTVS